MSKEITRRMRAAVNKKKKTTVYCPTSVAITEKSINFVPRIRTFDGKKVGLLWNGKPNGDFFLNRVAELLEKSYQGVRIIKLWEVDPHRTAHADKKSAETLDFIARSADIVIAGQGD